jgi:hypothetical protein
MKHVLYISLLLFASVANAGGWTATVRVSNIEVIRDAGFQIGGEFGNPSFCSRPNFVFVSINHPQYAELLSTAMAAFTNGKRLKIYSHQCTDYGWHSGTFNELTVDGAMFLRH